MTDLLIAYDITHPKRLARVHRALTRFAVPIQYSVFIAQGDLRTLKARLAEVVALIDPDADDLRAYPLPQRGMKLRLGRATLPEGIYHTALPAAWHDLA